VAQCSKSGRGFAAVPGPAGREARTTGVIAQWTAACGAASYLGACVLRRPRRAVKTLLPHAVVPNPKARWRSDK